MDRYSVACAPSYRDYFFGSKWLVDGVGIALIALPSVRRFLFARDGWLWLTLSSAQDPFLCLR